jgi:hypothetical protein
MFRGLNYFLKNNCFVLSDSSGKVHTLRQFPDYAPGGVAVSPRFIETWLEFLFLEIPAQALLLLSLVHDCIAVIEKNLQSSNRPNSLKLGTVGI